MHLKQGLAIYVKEGLETPTPLGKEVHTGLLEKQLEAYGWYESIKKFAMGDQELN